MKRRQSAYEWRWCKTIKAYVVAYRDKSCPHCGKVHLATPAEL